MRRAGPGFIHTPFQWRWRARPRLLVVIAIANDGRAVERSCLASLRRGRAASLRHLLPCPAAPISPHCSPLPVRLRPHRLPTSP